MTRSKHWSLLPYLAVLLEIWMGYRPIELDVRQNVTIDAMRSRDNDILSRRETLVNEMSA